MDIDNGDITIEDHEGRRFRLRDVVTGRFRGDYDPDARSYAKGDIVVVGDTQYYALDSIDDVPPVFEVGSSPQLWRKVPIHSQDSTGTGDTGPPPSAVPLIMQEADYQALEAADPTQHYVISDDGGSHVAAVYLGNVLLFSDAARPPASLSPPTIAYTGTLAAGTVLSISRGQWRGTPSSRTFQWKRDGVDIGGATGSTYTLVTGDQAHAITCAVTATNQSGTATAVLTAALTIPTFPLYDDLAETSDTAITSHTSNSGHTWTNAVASGITVIGGLSRARGSSSATLSIATSSWTPPGTNYMVRTSVVLASSLDGMGHGLRVDANGNGYFVTWDRAEGRYTIFKRTGGTAGGAGATVTVLAQPTATLSSARYLQLEISGTTLTLKEAAAVSDLAAVSGGVVTVDPTGDGLTAAGKAALYTRAASFSSSTRVQVQEIVADAIPVVPPVPVNTALPVISGTKNIGDTLTVTPGTWTNSPTLTHQWLRNSQPINGATGTTYVIAAADAGQSITVAEVAVNAAAPTGVSVISAAYTGIGGSTPVGTFSGQLFASDGVWNRVYDPAVDLTIPNSADVALNFARQGLKRNPQTGVASTSIGSPGVNSTSFSTSLYVVSGNAMTKVRMALIDYSKLKIDSAGLQNQITAVPVVPNSVGARPWPHEAIFNAANGSTSGWDGHCVIYDADSDTMYEFWKYRNWYEDGSTPITIIVANNTATDQTLAAGTDLTLAAQAGGTIGFKTSFATVIPANSSKDVLIQPNVVTNDGATSAWAFAADGTTRIGASNPQLVAPPTWVGSVAPGYVPKRHFFLDFAGDANHPAGAQGVYSCQWGGVMTTASTNSGFFSGKQFSWGATACSLSLAGGLITAADLRKGSIDHALACCVRYASNRVRKPAQRTDGSDVQTPPAPAEGQRFILDPAIDENDPKYATWPLLPLMIKAAKKYGIIVRDRGGGVTFYSEDPVTSGLSLKTDWLNGATSSTMLSHFPWASLFAVARYTTTEPLCDRSLNVVPEGT